MFSRRLLAIGIVLGIFASPGCVLGGDTYFRVSGTLAEESEQGGAPCRLEIHAASSGRLIDYRSVGRNFQQSFVLPARAMEYYFEAKCSEGRVYRSKNYRFGDRDTFNKTVDLGQLSVASK